MFSTSMSSSTRSRTRRRDVGAVEERRQVATAEPSTITIADSRGQWGSQLQFVLACVGYAVGLGNVWRFPYLCYSNGGGTFLIPYVVCLIFLGIPSFYLELILGQYGSLGPQAIFAKISPIFQGLGWTSVLIAFLVSLYYNVIIAWTLIYLYLSFRKELLWKRCDNEWNTLNCTSSFMDEECLEKNKEAPFFYNQTCLAVKPLATISRTATEEFYTEYVLNKGEGFEHIGNIEWKLALALFVAWLIVFLCIWGGVETTGKVVYFSATFPYVVLSLLLVRGVTLPGSGLGLEFYLKPDWNILKNPETWRSAAQQIFYSLGSGLGGLFTMASYNNFDNNCFRDAVLVSLMYIPPTVTQPFMLNVTGEMFSNCSTSVFAGFAIFSTLGYLAHQLGYTTAEQVRSVITQSKGLAFITFPEATLHMPLPQLWSVLFFMMLLFLGLDSEFAMVETVTTAIMDTFPRLRRNRMTKALVVGSVCVFMFIAGLIMTTRAGSFYFDLLDGHSAGISLMLTIFMEVVVISHVYGMKSFVEDIQLMLGASENGWFTCFLGNTGWFWRICWMAIAPVMLLVITVWSLFDTFKQGITKSEKITTVKNQIVVTFDYVWPWWIQVLIFFMEFSPLFLIAGFGVFQIVKNRRSDKHWLALFEPTDDWTPKTERDRMQMEKTISSLTKRNKAEEKKGKGADEDEEAQLHLD